MTPEQWERLQSLLVEALALPSSEREAFIAAACRDDDAVGEELRSLLALSEDVPERQSLPDPWFHAISATEAPRFAEGDRVADRYRIESLLGRGGMGEVYQAWDEELSIPVALKTLHLTLSTEEARKRLRMEGLLARTIWHPNVYRLYDLGSHGEGEEAIWFLTMELLAGRTLAEVLEREPALAPERALNLAAQMAAGLGAAHRAGIIHLDFKPANVLLVEREGGEQAVVTDFGIARANSGVEGTAARNSESGTIGGTPAYMSPEQITGGALGPAADIYALGVVLFEMVTGQLPFPNDSSLSVGSRRLHEDAPSPRTLRPELSTHWERTIARCLERDPAKRFAQAEDVAHALVGRTTAIEVDGRSRPAGRSHFLPAERDAFVGREAELDELTRNLAKSPLVTLVGAGGMGKTRLATRLGWQTLEQWPGGVWFADLAEARGENALVQAVARSLGVELRPADPIAQIGHAIAARGRCLLILDNFEQLVPDGVAVVATWLARAGDARFLVTSRQRLALGEEELVQRAESLSIEAGVELFRTRATWLRPGYRCEGEDAEAAREIVRLVDGMPLAIELAAGRIRVMDTIQIVAEMRRRFSLLTGGGTARHATLAEAFEGSWELLSPSEKTAWAQFSVFEGGFTLEAAEAVLAFDRPDGTPGVTVILQSLVERSLLRTSVATAVTRAGSSALRFEMLASLQEYARMKLRGEGGGSSIAPHEARQSESTTLARHGAFFAQLAGGDAGWRELEAELGNLVQACRRAVERNDAAVAVATLRGCQAVFSRRGPSGAMVDLGSLVLQVPGLNDPQRARVLAILSAAESTSGFTAASVAHGESALALFRDAGDRAGESEVLGRLALTLLLLSKPDEARRGAEASIEVSREIGAGEQECIALGFLGELNYGEGRTQEARGNWELGLSIARRLGHRALEATNLINLGTLYFDDAQLEEAERCFATALAIEREAGGRVPQGVALGNLGLLCQTRGELDEALGRFEGALEIHRSVGYRRYEGTCLALLGNLHRERGDLERARACLESALSIQREVGNRSLEARTLADLGLVDFVCGRLESSELAYASALGTARETRDRLLEAMTLCRLGDLHRKQGRLDDARSALAESDAALRPIGELFELTKLLCARAELELDCGDAASALAAFQEAAQLAVQTRSGPRTEIGRMVGSLRARLGTTNEG